MNRQRLYSSLSAFVTLLGVGIAMGAVLTSIGFPTGIDTDSLLTGLGIAVAGAGAGIQFWSPSAESASEDEASSR